VTLLQRAWAWLDRVEEAFIALALGLMTVLTFIQVVLRYVFHSGLVWSLEATTYTFGWLVVVGMAYGVRTGAHIAVDLLTRTLAPPLQRAGAGVALGVSLVYCALMAYGSVRLVAGLMRLGHFAQDIPLPRWLLASILPVGFVLLALRLVQVGWRYFAPANRLAIGVASGKGAGSGNGQSDGSDADRGAR
jgi:C4-dicarboxylate transporter DctQ subunit